MGVLGVQGLRVYRVWGLGFEALGVGAGAFGFRVADSIPIELDAYVTLDPEP